VSGAEHQTLALARYLRRHQHVTLLANDELVSILGAEPFFRDYTAGLDVRPSVGFPRGSRAHAGRRAATRPALPATAGHARPASCAACDRTTVHIVLAPSFFAYAPFFGRLPFPVVLTLSGEMRYARHFYGQAKRLAVRYAVARADALVVCSADEMINLAAIAPAALGRAVLLDNFTDVARFAPDAAKSPLVIFAARLHPEKGALLFLEAAARVHETRPEARFVLMGRGEEEADVARRLAALGLDGVVERGFAADLAPLFARSTIFVSCQRYENLGSSSLLEAMASGNAVVATDVGQTGASSTTPSGSACPQTRCHSPGGSAPCWTTRPGHPARPGRPRAHLAAVRPRPLPRAAARRLRPRPAAPRRAHRLSAGRRNARSTGSTGTKGSPAHGGQQQRTTGEQQQGGEPQHDADRQREARRGHQGRSCAADW
jgi:glycosyltransferase involved in cell wall biosynthesis